MSDINCCVLIACELFYILNGKNKNLFPRIRKLDKKNYLKDRTVCKSCYNNNRRKNKNQQPKIDNFNNNNNSRTLIIGFSNCGNEPHSTSKARINFHNYNVTESIS